MGILLLGALLCFFQVSQEYEKQLIIAWEMFYQGKYEEANQAALLARSIFPDGPESYEIHAVVLLFQLRQRVEADGSGEKKKSVTYCTDCPMLLGEFELDEKRGIELTKAHLARNPGDHEMQYFLAKFNLNRIWLNLQVLGKKRGWKEYQEAQKSLAIVLSEEPNHVRALTASAWINFILAEQNFFARMLLGWGSKERAFADLGIAISCSSCPEADVFEAKFALLEMLRRGKRYSEYRLLAAELYHRFPENQSLLKIINSPNQK